MKKILSLLIGFAVVLTPVISQAGTKNVELNDYRIANDTMSLQLPGNWYINSPDEINEEFLTHTENTERKLKKYLSDSDIAYNILSKDLAQEINIIVQHNSTTKLLFDFNTLNETKLTEQADVLISQGTQESETESTTFETYSLEKINQCTFMIFEGSVVTEDTEGQFIQYTTTINGYGITLSYRAYAGANMEDGRQLMQTIVKSLSVDEIQETNRKQTAILQILPPALLVIGFVGFTVYMFIRQLKKNKNG